jgi:hypothetical protein
MTTSLVIEVSDEAFHGMIVDEMNEVLAYEWGVSKKLRKALKRVREYYTAPVISEETNWEADDSDYEAIPNDYDRAYITPYPTPMDMRTPFSIEPKVELHDFWDS